MKFDPKNTFLKKTYRYLRNRFRWMQESKPLVMGQQGLVFQRKDRTVVKVIRKTPYTHPTHEADVLRALGTCKEPRLNIPKLLDFIPVADENAPISSVLILSRVPGGHISSSGPHTQAGAYGHALGRMAGSLHQAFAAIAPLLEYIDPEGIKKAQIPRGWYIPILEDKVHALAPHLYGPEMEKLQDVFNAYSARRPQQLSWIHSDLHSGNILFESGEATGVIDFECALPDIRESEFSSFVMPPFDERILDGIGEGYLETSGISLDRRLISTIATLDCAMRTSLQIERGKDPMVSTASLGQILGATENFFGPHVPYGLGA